MWGGRCSRCLCGSFPNDDRATAARNSVHARERTVNAALEKRFPDHNWTSDKTFAHRTFRIGVDMRCRAWTTASPATRSANAPLRSRSCVCS